MALKRPFPAYKGPDKQVFVCYAHADAAIVFPEIKQLHERGINIWYDEGIEVGEEWRTEIAEALDKAESVLFYQSAASSHSRHCVREISYALNRDIPVIRIDLDGSELPPGLRLGLEVEQALEPRLYSKAEYTAKLLQALSSSAHRSPAQPRQAPARAPARRWQYPIFGLVIAALIGGIWWTRQQAAAPAVARAESDMSVSTIAVLPFEDISPSSDQAYLGNGIADELRLELQRLDGLRVAGRTSSNAYAQEDGKKIGERLNVESVLEGSVRKDGNQVRITVQLTNVADGFTIWSESYNRELEKLFEMQEEIATSVAGSLGVSLGVGGANAFRGAGTRNIEAYDAYLRAQRMYWNEEAVQKAIPLLEQAVKLDPNYAIAWSELANRRLVEIWDADVNEVPKIVDRAYRLARRGAKLNPDSAGVQSVLGLIAMVRLNWVASEEAHTHAIAELPDRGTIERYAMMLIRVGRMSYAQVQIDRATAVEPLDGQPPVFAWHASLSQGRFEEAETRSNWQRGIDIIENNLDIAFNQRDPEALKAAIRAIPEATDSYPNADRRARFLNRSYSNLYGPLLAEFDSPERVLSMLRDVHRDESLHWPRKLHDIAMTAAYFGDPQFALSVKHEEVRLKPVRFGAIWYPVMSDARRLAEFKSFVAEFGLVDYWRAFGWADACQARGDDDFECS